MSSESSTSRAKPARDNSFQVRHLYLLLAMAGATWAVVVSPHTHPAALLLLSAAILAAGFAASALHQALLGFFTGDAVMPPVLKSRDRAAIEADKALVLRSIKELEFDRAMGKVSDADFSEIGGRLRARAVALMNDLDLDAARSGNRTKASKPPAEGGVAMTAREDDQIASHCGACGAARDPDAVFCKHCGARL